MKGEGENIPLIQLPWRPQLTPATKEAIPPYCNRNRIPLLLGRIAWWIRP